MALPDGVPVQPLLVDGRVYLPVDALIAWFEETCPDPGEAIATPRQYANALRRLSEGALS